MRGANGNTQVQYVELRMASSGQTQLSGHDICFFDPAGNPWARFTFPGNVSSGGQGSSILIASPSMDAIWPQAPDFVFGPGNTVPFDLSADPSNPVYEGFGQGKVAFGSDSATVPGDMCGAQFGVIDSVAYGAAYTGPVDYGTQVASDVPLTGEFAVKLTGALCNPCARDNSIDYSIVDVTDPANYPRNNAGQSGPLGDGGTPTPTPTNGPTPSPTPTPTTEPSPSSGPLQIQGDVNCDEQVTSVDALFILREVAGLGPAACAGNGDVNCDGDRTSVDALGVLRYVAGLPVNQNEPCPDIGTAV
jgi:hypothetical protein